MQPLVVLEDVSVTYRLPKERIRSLKEFWIHLLKGRLEYEDYSALKAVNLDVRRGEALGVVGKKRVGQEHVAQSDCGCNQTNSWDTASEGKGGSLAGTWCRL